MGFYNNIGNAYRNLVNVIAKCQLCSSAYLYDFDHRSKRTSKIEPTIHTLAKVDNKLNLVLTSDMWSTGNRNGHVSDVNLGTYKIPLMQSILYDVYEDLLDNLTPRKFNISIDGSGERSNKQYLYAELRFHEGNPNNTLFVIYMTLEYHVDENYKITFKPIYLGLEDLSRYSDGYLRKYDCDKLVIEEVKD